MDLTTVFCDIDDFCREFTLESPQELLPMPSPRRNRRAEVADWSSATSPAAAAKMAALRPVTRGAEPCPGRAPSATIARLVAEAKP